jgi:hypothetical protein
MNNEFIETVRVSIINKLENSRSFTDADKSLLRANKINETSLRAFLHLGTKPRVDTLVDYCNVFKIKLTSKSLQ